MILRARRESQHCSWGDLPFKNRRRLFFITPMSITGSSVAIGRSGPGSTSAQKPIQPITVSHVRTRSIKTHGLSIQFSIPFPFTE